jgi:N-acetylmuramoyl-L-alanine amidase
VVIDPGHEAPGNRGNTSAECRKEADVMAEVATPLVARLNGAFSIRESRTAGQIVDYPTRIAAADAWPAEALVSLHSDARDDWRLDPETGCPRNTGAHGFTVLWSDEGSPELVGARKSLAEALAARLIEAGFPPYGGEDYVDLYAGDPLHPGVFVDRHQPGQRIGMLRRPAVPSVIVETHQALDPDEVARWAEPATLDAFALAIRAGLVDWFSRP